MNQLHLHAVPAELPFGPAFEPKKIRKVLLIQPPAFSNNLRGDMNPNVPLGICYIAGMLERLGYDVVMLDAFIEGWHEETRITSDKLRVGLPFERIREFIADHAPDAVGITSMFTSQRKNAHAVAQIAKSVDPGIKVVLGGAHPTSAPAMVLDDPDVDAIVLGEGDNVIGRLFESFAAGRPRDLDGVGYRATDGRHVVLEKTRQIEDLDSLPFPARHLLPMEKYFAAGIRHGGYCTGERATSMITSRGCQYRCNFCTAFKVFTRTPRMRSIQSIAAELQHLVDTYRVDEVFFEDDQFIAKQRHTEELLDVMARFNLKFDTPNGVSSWLLNDTLIKKMKTAGCYRVNLAIESGNQDVLDKIINKPVKLDKVPSLVRSIKQAGMEVGTFLVVGNIASTRVETVEEVRDSFRFARRIRTRPHVSYLTAYPGSAVLDIATDKGYLVPGFDWDDLTITKQQLQTPEWTPEQLRQVVEEERIKTQLWFWLTTPREFFASIAEYLKNDPWLGVVKLAKFVRSLVAVQLHAKVRPWGA